MAKKSRLQGMGWKPDLPSHRDWPLRMSAVGSKSVDQLPDDSGDRREQNPPVRDQGNIGSCVGFSATAAVGWLRRTDRDKYSTVYSPLQMYYDARVADGIQWKDIDAGAYIRDAINCLRKTGVAPESRWPYKPTKFSTKPNPTTYKEAARWKLGAHWRCNGIEDIMRALASGFAVVGGLTLFASAFTKQVDETGRIPMPSRFDPLEGGHAVYFDRYNRSERLLRFQNSWGPRWGDDGYGYVPFDYIHPNLADDFWAMELEAPETTPWKD